MKDFLMFMRKAALAGAAAFAVFSCQNVKEEEPEVAEAPALCRTIRFHASELKTKAQFGTPEGGVYPTLWTSNDTEAKISLNYGKALAAEVTPSSDGTTSTLSAQVDFEGVDGPFTFFAVSPSSAAMSLSPSRQSWKVTIPGEQTPSAGSVDENAILLAASSVTYETSAQIADVDLFFSHLTAYGRLSLTNLDLIPSGATVQAVEMTATTPLVGDWFWACEASQEGGHTLIDYGASYTITLNTNRTSDLWFACAPVDLSGEMMTVRVITDRGVLEKLIEFDGSNFQLQAGVTAVFSVDMSEQAGAEFTDRSGSGSGNGAFALVTSASSLQAGDEVLIVCTSEGKALGALNSSGNFRDPVDISVSGDVIASAGSATVLTLDAGSTAGTWAFKDGSNYLASASSGNYLKNVTSLSSNASWSIGITSAGVATIQAQSGSSTYLQYNSSSPRFSCYGSANQKAVSLFRRSGGGSTLPSADDPVLQETEYGAYLGDNLTWRMAEGTNQMTRAYSGETLTFTLIDALVVEELEISGYTKSKAKGDPAFPVTVNWRKGFAKKQAGVVYNMAVVKESGPKVWLSDGNGHGVIIKK